MQTYDIIMLVVMGAAILFGFWKGLAWQVASFAAIVVSYFVAYNFREPVAKMISTEEPWNKFLAMLILYVGTSAVIWIGFRMTTDMIDRMKLKEFDRQLGASLGAIKGVVVCVIITFFSLTLLGESNKQAIAHSVSGHLIAGGIDQLDAVIPEETHAKLAPYLQKLDDGLGHDHSEHDDHWLTDGNFGKKDEGVPLPSLLPDVGQVGERFTSSQNNQSQNNQPQNTTPQNTGFPSQTVGRPPTLGAQPNLASQREYSQPMENVPPPPGFTAPSYSQPTYPQPTYSQPYQQSGYQQPIPQVTQQPGSYQPSNYQPPVAGQPQFGSQFTPPVISQPPNTPQPVAPPALPVEIEQGLEAARNAQSIYDRFRQFTD